MEGVGGVVRRASVLYIQQSSKGEARGVSIGVAPFLFFFDLCPATRVGRSLWGALLNRSCTSMRAML